MAERIYQRKNYLLENTPSLDFANVKEEILQSQSTSAALDKISAFAFKSAREKAEEAGALYGATKYPTAQQLKDAQAKDIDITDLFSEDYTYFGQKAREVQAAQLRLELDSQTSSEFARLKGIIDATGGSAINEKDIETTINAIIDGNSKLLTKVSAEQTLKYRASAGSLGREVLDHINKKIVEDYKANNEIKLTEDLKNAAPNISLIIQNNLDSDVANEKINIIALGLKQRADMMPGPERQKAYIKIDKFIDDQKIQEITNYVVNDKDFFTGDDDKVQKLNQGIVGDRTNLYASLSVDSEGNDLKAKVRAKVAEQLSVAYSATTHAQTLKDNEDKSSINLLAMDFYKTKDKSKLNQIEAIIRKNPRAMSNSEYEKLIESLNGKPQFTRQVINLQDEVGVGRIATLEQLRDRAKYYNINEATLNEHIYPLFYKTRDRAYDKKLTEYARNKTPPGVDAYTASRILTQKDFEVENEVKANIKINEDAGKKIKPDNKIDVLEEKFQALNKDPLKVQADAALANLQNAITKYGVVGVVINDTTALDETVVMQVERQKTLDNTQKQEVLKAIGDYKKLKEQLANKQ